ncbi:hypothetical protein TYRP_011077 [Tyrophagus putrescentiae]|nr:hypothetical protein TYRP_011077 [Tyrophagus putrescentiae]
MERTEAEIELYSTGHQSQSAQLPHFLAKPFIRQKMPPTTESYDYYDSTNSTTSTPIKRSPEDVSFFTQLMILYCMGLVNCCLCYAFQMLFDCYDKCTGHGEKRQQDEEALQKKLHFLMPPPPMYPELERKRRDL